MIPQCSRTDFPDSLFLIDCTKIPEKRKPSRMESITLRKKTIKSANPFCNNPTCQLILVCSFIKKTPKCINPPLWNDRNFTDSINKNSQNSVPSSPKSIPSPRLSQKNYLNPIVLKEKDKMISREFKSFWKKSNKSNFSNALLSPRFSTRADPDPNQLSDTKSCTMIQSLDKWRGKHPCNHWNSHEKSQE
jgi:hypothetical protein